MILLKPSVLVMSPTAVTANHLIYSDTIYGILRMTSLQNLKKQLLHEANTKLSNKCLK